MHKAFLLNIFIFISFLSFSQKLSFVFPDNNYTTSDSSITFTWNYEALTGYTYNLQISLDTTFSTILTDTNVNANICTIDTFNLNKKYYCRVRAYDGINYTSWSDYRIFNIFNPNSISSIGLWLDADASNVIFEAGKVKEWKDLSPNNNHLTQNDASKQPLWTDSLINNKPCVVFTTTLDYLNFTDTINKLGGTIFTVLQNTESNDSYFIGYSEYSNGGGLHTNLTNSIFWFNGNRHCDVSHDTITDFCLISVIQDTTSNGNYWESYYASIKINQNKGDSISTYGYKMAMNWLGTTNWYGGKKPCVGNMAELIYYSTPINDSLYNLNEQYLRYKYAPPANLGYDIHIPYGFCDTTIDAGARFTNYVWSTDTVADTLQTITVNQSGQYSVTVTDIFGFQSADTVMVYYPEPTQLTDTAICLGDTITWDCNMDTSYHFIWSTGDTTPQIQIWQQGFYYLQVADSFGCKFYSDTIFVKVDSFPQTSTLGNDTSLCAGTNITLLSGNTTAASYAWSTGDTTQYITINYPDNYAITVTDTLGCVAKDTIQITIHGQAPVPDFTWQNICLGDSTQLTDSSYTTDNSNIISWQWQLPDTLSSQNVSYTFPDTGNFPVTLTISTDSNCSNTIVKQVTIHPLPAADFTTTQLCNNTPIYFSEAINSVDSIATYLWDFGDAMTDSTANPVHEYTNSGNFPVSLNITSLFGCKDSITQTLEIKPSPVVDFSHTALCSGKQTQFNDLSVTPPIFPIISWQWDFGDNTSSTYNNPIHIYSDTGTYIISLAAQSLNGCTQIKTETITVFPSQQTDFYADSLCANTTNQFIDSTLITGDSIIAWSWYINNELKSNEQSPEFYFHDDGTYLISLITQTSHQCKDSITKYVPVNPAPPSKFSFYPEIGTPSYSLSFSTDSNLNYLWNFGDSFTSTEQNPLHLYTDSGSYQVTLITTNNYGCHDTTQKTVLVVLPVYDVAIIDYTPKQTANYLSFSCRFLNMGSLPLDSVNLTLQIQGAPYIMEKWTGHIMPGAVVTYQFASHYQINGSVPAATCVEAMVSGQTKDPTPENNLKCSNSTNDFIFYSLFPNPAENAIFVEFNNPQKQTINYQIIDKLGKIVISDKLENVAKGFQRTKINITYLESGTYTLKIFSNIDSAEKQFMVY